MPRLGRFGRQLRSLFFKASVAEEVDAELGFHVAMRARELEAQGHPREEAHRLAAQRLGDLDVLKRSMRDLGEARERTAARAEYLAEFVQDARFAIRQIAKAPAFAAVAIGTLALGIAGTTAIFSAVRAVVLRPWPYAHPDRTVFVTERWHDNDGGFAVGNYVDLMAMSTSFERAAGEQFQGFSMGDGDEPERVTGGRVTHDYFAVFGAQPLLGRLFTPDEDEPGHEGVVVLGEDLWRRRYGADRGLVGRDVTINGEPYTVVGVMPAAFDPSLSAEQLWVPSGYTPERKAMHDEHFLRVFGLLKPGVPLAHARGELAAGMTELSRRFQAQVSPQLTVGLYELGPFLLGNVGGQLWMLLGAVGLVLLIACGNVANLLLARGAARSREIAIRAALGAGHGRLLRQLLTETLVLAGVAAFAGAALAVALVRVLVAAAPAGQFPRLAGTRVDAMVLGFALLVALLATLVSGLMPAWREARRDLQSALRGGGPGAGTPSSRDRLRFGLVAAEVALALTLLVGAGLLIRSAIHLQRTPIGMELPGVMAARLALPAARYDTPERVRQAFEQVTVDLRNAPGISHAAAVSVSPVSGQGGRNGLVPEGRAQAPESAIISGLRVVTADYFATVRLPLRRGRLFSADDQAGSPRVMVVSERLAALAWPGADPIGKRIDCCEGSPDGPVWKTVVGVVGDVRSAGPMRDPGPEFYLPIAQAPSAYWTWTNRTMSLVARSEAAPEVAIGAMRAAVRRLDPSLPLFGVSTAEDLLATTLAPARFNTLLLGVLAALGLLLAAAGIYSVIAYFVTLRTHEIGVRMALGARGGDIIRLLTWQGLRPVAAGLLLGTLGASAATRLLRGALYGVTATDPATFAGVAALFTLVALAAIVVPARRAARVEPTRALTD
jgi:predicted permease